MRVNRTENNPAQAAEASRAGRPERAEHAKNAKKTDKPAEAAENGDVSASISGKAREFSKAKAIAAETPDVREEKIAELKKRIAAGKYKIDDNAVADRLVDDHIAMHEIG